MVKLHAQLESALKVRINSNDEIILALKRLSEMGKLDKPKELAIFAIILDRLGKMEDDASIEESLKNPIQEELDEAKQKIEDTVLEETGSPMNGVANNIVDEPETPVVTEFTAESVTDPAPEDTTANTP